MKYALKDVYFEAPSIGCVFRNPPNEDPVFSKVLKYDNIGELYVSWLKLTEKHLNFAKK